MIKEPKKYLFIYLKDRETNPKFFFNIHAGPRPDDRAAHAKTPFISLEKKYALNDLERVEDIGFWVTIHLLAERRIKEKAENGTILYADYDEPAIIMDTQRMKKYQEGEFHTFIPLPPIPQDLNTEQIRRDSLLQMKVGRIILSALLD
jgi:hypothetical protein